MRTGDLLRLKKGELRQKVHLLVGHEYGSSLTSYAVLMAPSGDLWKMHLYILEQSYEVISDVQD
jgi:hypothetical protein